jgi:hypothetical protein
VRAMIKLDITHTTLRGDAATLVNSRLSTSLAPLSLRGARARKPVDWQQEQGKESEKGGDVRELMRR